MIAFILNTILVMLTIIPTTATAATGGILGNISFDNILENVSTIISPLTQVTLAICFLSGVAFIFRGVAMLHHFGQVQNQMSRPNGITGPFIYIFIGAALIYIPSTTSTFSATIFGSTGFDNLFGSADHITFNSSSTNPDSSSPTGTGGEYYTINNVPNYETQGGNKLLYYFDMSGGQEWAKLIDLIVKFIQFVGLIAFVRGWFLLSHVANGSGSQQNDFSKGLIHIIGGIVSINFIPFMHAISLLMLSGV